MPDAVRVIRTSSDSPVRVIRTTDGVSQASLAAQLGNYVAIVNGVTATVTGDPADPDVTLYMNGVEL